MRTLPTAASTLSPTRARRVDQRFRCCGRTADGCRLGPSGDALRAAAQALRDGQIVAVKGIGGFHLACRADDEAAVAALRARKRREDKPFALMVATVEDAVRIVQLGRRRA